MRVLSLVLKIEVHVHVDVYVYICVLAESVCGDTAPSIHVRCLVRHTLTLLIVIQVLYCSPVGLHFLSQVLVCLTVCVFSPDCHGGEWRDEGKEGEFGERLGRIDEDTLYVCW